MHPRAADGRKIAGAESNRQRHGGPSLHERSRRPRVHHWTRAGAIIQARRSRGTDARSAPGGYSAPVTWRADAWFLVRSPSRAHLLGIGVRCGRLRGRRLRHEANQMPSTTINAARITAARGVTAYLRQSGPSGRNRDQVPPWSILTPGPKALTRCRCPPNNSTVARVGGDGRFRCDVSRRSETRRTAARRCRLATDQAQMIAGRNMA